MNRFSYAKRGWCITDSTTRRKEKIEVKNSQIEEPGGRKPVRNMLGDIGKR
jgi:hypothetical protein